MKKLQSDEQFKFNLQLFAENNEDDNEDTQDQETDEETQDIDNDNGNDGKFDIKSILENEEFKNYVQSFSDKRVTDALKKNDKKWKQELKTQEQKAKMTEEELLAEREREINSREIKLKKVEYFNEKDYDLDLIDFINVNEEEEIEDKTEKLMTSINSVVEKRVAKEVEKRLKDSSYTPPSGKGEGKYSLDDLSKMSIEEINKYWDKVK